LEYKDFLKAGFYLSQITKSTNRGSMNLYGSYTSPFVRHCRIVLIETQQAFDFIETDAASSAEKSPTKRVPFLQDGAIFYTDSSSIIKYLREKAGGTFCATAKELDEYCLATTALDTTINVFFMERDKAKIEEIPYLQRQADRIQSILTELDALNLPTTAPYNDAQLRLACFMGWAKFRKRVDFTGYKNLEAFYENIMNYAPFKNTQPPQ